MKNQGYTLTIKGFYGNEVKRVERRNIYINHPESIKNISSEIQGILIK